MDLAADRSRSPDVGVTTALTTSDVVARYAARHPVTATVAGIEGHDGRWPDWSLDGLAGQGEESASLSHALRVAGPDSDAVLEADRQVALGALSLERDELSGTHMMRGNPSLWMGEAAFGLIGLLSDHDDARLDLRTDALVERLHGLAHFLVDAHATVAPAAVPTAFLERARRECAALEALVVRGIGQWCDAHQRTDAQRIEVQRGVESATAAIARCTHWLSSLAGTDTAPVTPGRAHFEAVVRDGHAMDEPITVLRAEAAEELASARATLDALIRGGGTGATWVDVQRQLEAEAVTADRYLDRYAEEWDRCVVVSERVIPMPRSSFDVTFMPIPGWAREAQPALYYLFYRSPSPWRWPSRYRYQVPPIDHLAGDALHERLRQWNLSQIRLNHVVHHGGLGHHRQNWANARARGPMARLAAVDGACRLALHAGGTMAEGWSCYAVELYEELGMLTPLEVIAEQHTRVRILCRALADITLHHDGGTLGEAEAIYTTHAMMPAAAARAEAVKNAMFPGMAIMYWLGTRTIHAARRAAERTPGFDLRDWHDRLLSFGALPLPVVVDLMKRGAIA
jgi:hypothetical protein